MRHLLVLGDSVSFHGPERAEAPHHPRLYANVCADSLGGDVEVDLVARMGWTARDGWWAVTKDPTVWGTFLPRADGVVLSLGHFDQLPAALPTWLRESIPYIRPGGLRRRVRTTYHSLAPRVIRASDGHLSQLSPRATSHYLSRIVTAIRALYPGIPIVRLLPSPYDSHIHPSARPHRPAVAAARVWCRDHEVPSVDLDHLVSTATNNPDGLHWGWDSHERVGTATAKTLLQAGWSA